MGKAREKLEWFGNAKDNAKDVSGTSSVKETFLNFAAY